MRSFSLADLPYLGGTIGYVEVWAVARVTSPQFEGPAQISLRVNGNVGTAQNIGQSYAAYSQRWTMNPGTGQAWTFAQVQALQAGVQAAYVDNGQIRVTQLYVVVSVTDPVVRTLYSYGQDDQLLTEQIAGSWTTTYTSDKNGNVKAKTEAMGTTTYAYDAENRLTSATTPTTSTSYSYAADGRRMKRVAAGTAVYYGYDSSGFAGYEDVNEEYNSAGAKTTGYVHGPGIDEPLGFKTTAWYEYSRDALGSVTRITNSAGGTVSTYRYDAFGSIRSQTGSNNTYGFTSRETEAALGLYYNRARYYDPGRGRFLSADPSGLAGGTNRYVYAAGNPTRWTDPSGMRIVEDPGGGGGGSVTGGSAPSGGGLSTVGRCLVLWGMMAFLIVSTIIGIQVGCWAVSSQLTGLEAVIGMTYAKVLYRYIPSFALAVAAWDFGQLVSVTVGLLFTVAAVFMASLNIWALLGFLGSWAARTAAWAILLGQIGLAIFSASLLIFEAGGLKASGCLS